MNTKVANRIFDVIIYFILILAVLVSIIPFLHIAAKSLSSNEAVMTMKVTLLPVDFTLEAYSRVIGDVSMVKSLLLTVLVTVAFTVLGMFLTICLAYALSRKGLRGQKVFLLLVLFTLYFNGGIIPHFINIFELKLYNTIWSIILPLALSPFNMIILRTFFLSSVPDSLEESAKLDGCGHIGILIKIFLPLSLPALATLSLFYAVGRWNAFSDALFYITERSLYPIQLKLYYLINAMGATETLDSAGSATQLAPDVIKSASVMFATIPILIVYPWLQKYFVTGITVGAVKG
ncbi:MAG: carbohydrate ABC transporter permease [Clostridia bacterium]|nr:carbohydrate ABC transporter permease [Clostridia bacterium]